MGVVAVSRKPDPTAAAPAPGLSQLLDQQNKKTGPGRNRPGEPRRPTCRYLRGRGNQAARCTAEPVSDPDDDSIELCARHLGLAVAAFSRLTAARKDAA